MSGMRGEKLAHRIMRMRGEGVSSKRRRTWPEPRRRELGSKAWSLEMSSLISSSEMLPRDDLRLDILALCRSSYVAAGRDKQHFSQQDRRQSSRTKLASRLCVHRWLALPG
uniref:Uncharacterized protein n=1 Tax=Setaria italica TaxID=4555 RepID=K3YWW9_SETIT